MIDIVTVHHNRHNREQALQLGEALKYFEPDVAYISIDNECDNIGFGPACNLGTSLGNSKVIGFLNPDVEVYGPFSHLVWASMSEPGRVIVGENFDKPEWEYRKWGCLEWVCGAAFFVDRDWFEAVGGFDSRFKWGWEETDLIRLAQEQGKGVKAIRLPIKHSSPAEDSLVDKAYKAGHFQAGADLFYSKWGRSHV